MLSPSSALPPPPVEGRANNDASSSASSDEVDLPQCKIKRNYNCSKCNFYTQNPRAYLLHSREVHFEKFKIFDCPQCVYASRHYQKLVRHVKMVHECATSNDNGLQSPETEPLEHVEDMLEEVEECEEDLSVMDDSDSIVPGADINSDCYRNIENSVSDLPKDKSKYFSCDKCNYVTLIKSRFTKHVKYHSMPMIKCTMCDFRTPYKWNLDRHMKNHGGTGSFCCSMCNFTADIKQSLTVHEMNHHMSAAGQPGGVRRRNRVGASELPLPYADKVLKDEEGSGDSRSSYCASELGLHADIEMVTCNSESNDATASEDAGKRYSSNSPDLQNHSSGDETKFNKLNRKPPRPIPQLIPLNASTPNQNKNAASEPPVKKMKLNSSTVSTEKLLCENQTQKEPAIRKKNESFFDRLKERILTETGDEGSLVCKNCGFASKCLSEHSVHEKVCSPHSNKVTSSTNHQNLSSTRCQNCRHRCKSSADLFNHLRTCQTSNSVPAATADTTVRNNSRCEDAAPHPMENVVFVWNNINQENNDKFVTPLDININDDSTLPEANRSFEAEVVDDNDGMNLSPSQAAGKKVFKCPHCPFWASTASRFHVHIVGHLNKKPFECSLCKYKSNWRWDITKHIKLKSARDPEHNEAKVLMTDETGRRNYSKYNKFLAVSLLNESGETEFRYVDPSTSPEAMMEVDESAHDAIENNTDGQPLNLQTFGGEHIKETVDDRNRDGKKVKKTLWKCKKCNYRDPSKEALLEHVREHSRPDSGYDDMKLLNAKKTETTPDPADLAYRCGHCNQLSNWKHVIQRHCRLKHEGIIKVITTLKPKPDPNAPPPVDATVDTCTRCPFRTDDKKEMQAHLQQHQPSAQSIFKCYFCPFFVKSEQELIVHLVLHGINDPEEYISKNMDCKSPQLPETGGCLSSSNKRHKCIECPYETNSKSQYMYHEQFHRLPADTPYKCPECNYSVSKRHLLHQHMRVHGIISKKMDFDEFDSCFNKSDTNLDDVMNLDEIPYVWVSAKNEFHKMYKCRYCSYVNSQECKIPNHEKIHCIDLENDITIYKCLECKFTCYNAGRLAGHAKGHGEIYGRIYCPVEDGIPDDEQIAKLRKVIEEEKLNNPDESIKEEWLARDNEGTKTLFFCQKCPARYCSDSELKIHDKFHDMSFVNKCKSCEFSVPQDTDMVSHSLVHTDEYHTKTKMLKFMHNSDPAHKQPKLELIHCAATSEITWVVLNPCKNYQILTETYRRTEPKQPQKHYCCKECPAKFFKSSALSYHMALHGGVGDFKCKKCTYVVKNSGNLAKHELLHEKESKLNKCDYDSGDDMDFKNIPISGTDLFQRKTEAQKRVLIDKDKLVKPNDHFPPVLQADPQFGYLMHGNPEFIYPTYLKNGRQKEKRYKCHKCPSAFEKREQYKIHLSLHGSKQRYKCELCDYSVKYYANYVQHMRKHQMNDEAQAERKKGGSGFVEADYPDNKQNDAADNIKLAIKTIPRGLPKSDFQQFSVSDQQTLRILQRRRSLNGSGKDPTTEVSPTKERKLHLCLLCPYSNQRQDALNNHYKRHDDTDVLASVNNKCSHCDLIVMQSHFLREHMKTHFNYQKMLNAECFVANQEVSFILTKVDEEESPVDLKLENAQTTMYKCDEEKIFVKMNTGEILATE